jgi:prepilin-type N-terminal cleavage/methylation domain-containing protein
MKKFPGFTLIELLVVITLIGILAIAVLSALNPIEQINKARDAGKRADSSQLLTAIDRYFASNEKFPWNNFTNYSASVDLAFSGTADLIGIGVCGSSDLSDGDVTGAGSGGCANLSTTPGHLISTQELKAQFGKRDYFKGTALEADKLYLFKEANEPSVSICFVPASRATRDTWDDVDTSLKDLAITAGVPTQVDVCTKASEPDWSDVTDVCMVCIPEE